MNPGFQSDPSPKSLLFLFQFNFFSINVKQIYQKVRISEIFRLFFDNICQYLFIDKHYGLFKVGSVFFSPVGPGFGHS